MLRLNRSVIIVCLVVLQSSLALGQQLNKPRPTRANVPYGDHERQVLDFWQAESAEPTPFVLFIHGGGFAAGSKESLKASTLKDLLDAGISVAAVNYRYYQQSPLPAALQDCRRALQFVRSKADGWNLDKTHAGATGGSAGAVASMYLAFHDEMADPTSSDPIARESTRLTCVATTAGQTTLDTHWWATNVPGWPKDEGIKQDTHAYRRWGISEADFTAVVNDSSALSLISKDDPPIWMSYWMRPGDSMPKDLKRATSWRIHHVSFGVALKEKMDSLGIESHLVHPRASRAYDGLIDFLIAKLKPTGFAVHAPYPPSPVIASVDFRFATECEFGRGSDQWPMTWGADGHLYAAWGDGWGWRGDKSGRKYSIGVTRIAATPPELQGTDVWGDGPGHGFAKPEALVALDDTLHMFWTRGDSINDLDDTATAESRDGGHSWTYGNDKAFPQAPAGFRVRGICQFGPGYQDSLDRFVYVYFGFNRQSDLFLGRVPSEHLFSSEQYEWFTGLAEDNVRATWSKSIKDRQPVFHDPNGYIWHIGVSYNSGLKRFLLTKPHYCPGDDRKTPLVRDSGVASFGLFDAPTPWGPWTTVHYQDNFKDGLVKFSYFIPTKLISQDGREFWLAWSGWPEYDSVRFVQGRLSLR
ncbi:Hypothetical protein PBC10988_4780 [Planctomycetales bacterium 10988]|nr:Hypothetical protein PBC10988_4780 [Planctomycetales bacterium 10988]